jgi:hypothetical protein
MTAYIHDDVFDEGLDLINGAATKLHILSTAAELTFTNVALYTLGEKDISAITNPNSITGPADRTAGGREVTIVEITDGAVTATGTATYFAIVDASRVLVSGPISGSQVVTSGNIFTLSAFTIGIPDPA